MPCIRKNTLRFAGALALAAALAVLPGGCAIGQSRPPSTRPLGEIAREERGEILAVRDTRIDLSTGQGNRIRASTPAVGVGPLAVRVPVTVGGEKRVEAPAEEITVQLASGKLMAVVQELSSPPFAPGERVRVLYERPNDITGEARQRVVRE